MPFVDGVYYPDYSAPQADVPADMLLQGQSLRGRTVRNHTSPSTRDTAMQAIPAALRQGAVQYVQGVGWMGYTKAGDPYDATAASWWRFDRVKGGQFNGQAENNNMFRIAAALCFFENNPPSGIACIWSGSDPNYMCSFGTFDGAGALIKVVNNVTGAQVNFPNTAQFFWIAVR